MQNEIAENRPGGEMRGSGEVCPNRIRQIKPRRDPIHNLIEASWIKRNVNVKFET